MQLDKASCYALFATVCIAQQPRDKPVQGRLVARLCDIPFEYLLKILQQLARNRILLSERGRTGGFMLAKPPDKITVLDVVETIQGPLHGRAAGSRREGATRLERTVERLCQEITDDARSRMSQLTIADLLNKTP